MMWNNSDLDILIKYIIILFGLVSTIWIIVYSIIGAIELKNILFPDEKKRTVELLWKYVETVVNYLEQMKKRDKVDNLSLRGLGEAKIKELLLAEGIDINISEWDSFIDILVESWVNRID